MHESIKIKQPNCGRESNKINKYIDKDRNNNESIEYFNKNTKTKWKWLH